MSVRAGATREENKSRGAQTGLDQESEAPAPDGVRRYYSSLALAALTIILIGLCALISVPFLPAITWGVALAIVAWPLHRRIARRLSRPWVAAVLSTTAVVLVILLPGLFVSYELALQAGSAAEKLHDSAEGAVRETLAELPGLGRVVEWMERVDVDVEAELRKLIASYNRDSANLVQGSIAALIQCLVAVFIIYYVFLDRAHFIHEIRDLLPLSREEGNQVFASAAESIHANLHATLIRGLIDGVSGGLLFWLLGLPAPLMWGVVMFVLSVLPIVGIPIVWVPAALYLALTGRWLSGLALVAWGVLSFVIVDYILYARLVGKRMHLHAVPALISFLGGLAVFGVSGMILGPAILAVTVAFLQVWKRRLTCVEPAIPGSSEAE